MRDLGQLEAAVMKRMWDWDRPVAVREVLEDLQRERRIAYTTVMTVLDNLHGKGLVRREKAGRAYHYVPAGTREEHTASLLSHVLDSSGDRSSALLHFVGNLEPTELADLRAALDDQDSST